MIFIATTYFPAADHRHYADDEVIAVTALDMSLAGTRSIN